MWSIKEYPNFERDTNSVDAFTSTGGTGWSSFKADFLLKYFSAHSFERIVKWMAYLFICDDHIELGRNTETADEVVNQSLDCIRRLEVMHVNGGEHKISLLGFKPFILCAYFVAEEILLDMNMEQRKRFIEVWRWYCFANTKEHELIESQLLDLDAITKVSIVCMKILLFCNQGNSFTKGSRRKRCHENVVRIN